MADPFFSEIKYLGSASEDFIEIAVDAGADVSNLVVTVYKSNGTIRSSNDISLLTPTTVNGKDVYLIERGDPTNFNGVAFGEAVSLSDSGTVFSFVSFDDTVGGVTAITGPANGMTSTDIGMAGSGSSLETTDGGATYFTQTTPDPNNVTCFVAGTRISTKAGLVRVEDLEDGADILTQNGTYKTLRKVFSRKLTQSDLDAKPNLYPVRITAGSMGTDLPARDLLVSRQHRMVMASPIVRRMFDTSAVLVAAIHMTDAPGIDVDTSLTSVTYFHLLFDDHEVIFAEGAPTESFFLGAEAIKTLPIASLDELKDIFPTVDLPLSLSASRHVIPSNRRQKQLLSRHVMNQKTLLSDVA